MAKGPAVVIIARHGARLDAADKTWHLTSPTPYDPPLTYGGWTQSKALGLRIAALLYERENETDNEGGGKANGATANADLALLDFSPLDESKTSNESQKQPETIRAVRRKHQIIIHSSPYLRCIQTSTAIAAGIAQYQPPSPSTQPHKTKAGQSAKGNSGIHTQSPLSRATAVSESLAVQAAAENAAGEDKQQLGIFGTKQPRPPRVLLRIDAFLGEWLSPDYFEDITPPPNSTMMVAGAKADLLRRGDYVEAQHNAHNSKGHFPGGWVKSNGPSASTSRTNTGDSTSSGASSLAQAMPFRERSSSQGSIASHSSRTSHGHSHSHHTPALSTAHKVPAHIYDPPVPSYAVSPADPIPRGYVNHARDACVDVDYQWDSMRPPQEWGDGGEYGDEWSTMHKRFRKGLGGMIAWYKEQGAVTPYEHVRGFTYRDHKPTPLYHKSDPGPSVDSASEQQEDEQDLVVILVTHGAGCNALLGAISNQPVLLDVGTASLSMAVRRPSFSRIPSMPTLATTRRPSIMDMGMSEEYTVKILASLDHLRPGIDPSKLPQSSSPATAARGSPTLEYRRRFTSSSNTNSPIDSPFALPEPYRGLNSSLGSMRRSSTSGSLSSSRLLSSNTAQSSTSSTASMTGLWSGLRTPAPDTWPQEGRKSPGHDMVLNFREVEKPAAQTDPPQEKQVEKEEDAVEKKNEDEHDDVAPLPTRRGSQYGLWGAPRPEPAANGLWAQPVTNMWGGGTRERGPKRRWTVSERD
ncbi:hypothetical protein BCR34DRAFT_492110 [Clohesyomyces aquaticus]|uniref:Histidine phosphatase superfamily n=1 Tax=Clohesyomyces aquaticus TaxID=1231657 RepID=A0A1Y1Z0Y8_9PLEO|nr:hypothetical protein BCR34DRAFT_492110 [Clohesyomyces aquaticus]